MKEIIHKILHSEMNEEIHSITEIEGLGSVNKVFDVQGSYGSYIVRLNEDPNKSTEYRKEKWCIEKVSNIDIPSPKLLHSGLMNEVLYMVQDKISGKNGELCNSDEKKKIWRDLGRYAKKYHQVQRIEDKRVEDAEFHKDWKARLEYNLNELNSEDALLNNNILNQEEHRKAKTFLSKLKSRTFQVGLVHGDLCPRNVILNKDNVYLLDWGMADINVIPHNELGIVLMSKEASQDEFQAFKEGYGISNSDFLAMEEDIRLLNFLHTLDKYRWAKDFAVENIEEYEENIKDTFNKLNAADNK